MNRGMVARACDPVIWEIQPESCGAVTVVTPVSSNWPRVDFYCHHRTNKTQLAQTVLRQLVTHQVNNPSMTVSGDIRKAHQVDIWAVVTGAAWGWV